MFSCHLFLISSVSVRSIPFLPFFVPIFAWNIHMITLIFFKISLVFPILLFSSISLHWKLCFYLKKKKKKLNMFSIVAAPICISINSVQGPSFLYILASTCYFGDFWLFWFGRCQAVSHCSFDLHFSDNYQCWPFFHMTIGHLHGFGKMSVRVFCQFFNQVVSFSDIDLCDLLIYLVKCARFI